MGVMPSVTCSTDSLQIVVLVEEQYFLLVHYPFTVDGSVNHKGFGYMALYAVSRG
jgi:hypothetical protein